MGHRVRFVLDAELHVPPAVDQGEASEVPEGAMRRADEHLAQWVLMTPTRVEAEYVFDEAYATAHPESLDGRHLALLHALLVFKLFDDGEVIVPPPQVEAALRWPAIDRPRAALR